MRQNKFHLGTTTTCGIACCSGWPQDERTGYRDYAASGPVLTKAVSSQDKTVSVCMTCTGRRGKRETANLVAKQAKTVVSVDFLQKKWASFVFWKNGPIYFSLSRVLGHVLCEKRRRFANRHRRLETIGQALGVGAL